MNPNNLDVRLLRFRSRREESALALATALHTGGRSNDALEVVRLGLSDNASDSSLMVLEGRIWFEQGDLAQAQAALIRAAKASPRDKEAYRWLAQVLMKRGEPARAVQVLERALTLDATDKSLQQAHMRAQRLARIASDPSLATGEIPVAAEARGAAREPEMVARPEPPPPPPVPMGVANDVIPGPVATRVAPPPMMMDEEPEEADDSPTAAYEMPQEVRDWLEAERASAAGVDAPAREQNDDPGLGLQNELSIDTEPPDMPTAPPAAPPSEAEPPEHVLEMLAQQGVFEPPGQASGQATWAPKSEVERAGNRVGKSLAISWAVAIAAAGVGYWGWTQWLGARRSDARALVSQAMAEAYDGQNVSLLAAEGHLAEARALDPKSEEALEQLLFVHATRALEDGSGDVGYLRNTLPRVESAQGNPALIAASKALLAVVDRNVAAAREQAQLALKTGADDARISYLIGRLYQRTGGPDAGALLAKASTKEPGLALAWAAQAELSMSAGEQQQALALLTKALGTDGKFLRAELWRVLLEVTPETAQASQKKLDELGARIQNGSASDKLLAKVARAHVARVLGNLDGARTALQGAGAVVVLDPELMVSLAQEASAASLHDLAYRAANAAFNAAPQVASYRKVLVDVLLQRGDGRAVLNALTDAADTDAWTLIAKARAELLAGSRDGVAEAKKSLARYRATPEGRGDVNASALLLRADLRLGANAESLLTAARSLGEQAQNDVAAQTALGEAAVLAGQPELALTALERAVKLDAYDADARYLLGRAQRLAGKPVEAKKELERAVELAPSHLQAREALGGYLLDSGDYDAALALFSSLRDDGAGASASLGMAEALLGRGTWSEAEAQLGKLDESLAKSPAAQLLSARVLVAKGKAADAVTLLEPLVAADQESRTVDTLTAYGDALFAADRVDTAAGAYDAALELDANSPDALVGRAMAAVRAEKVTECVALLERAQAALQTRVRPPRLHAALLVTWAKAQLIKNDFEGAKQKLSEAVAMKGAPAEVHFWLGETLAKTKSAGATESYAKYLELEPNGYYAARAKKALAPR